MTPSVQPSPYPEAGEVIDGKYKIEGYIGEGGMGAVARAMHLVRKAPVALKFMSPAVIYQVGSVDRFVNEAVAASALKSDHVVQVFDVGTLPSGAPYLVLELLDGHDAATLLEREPGGIEVPRACHIVLQVLRALEVAHANGIIHRDLKPSNCFLVNNEGDLDFVKLLDFGISKVTREGEASITQTNTALGTPLYMSPEQARSARDVDLRTDIYSTGVILYELLCGQAPHMVEGGEFTAVLYRLFTTDAPPLAERRAGLPKGLVEIVHKALSRDASQRFSTAHEFAEAIVPYCDARSAIEITRLKARVVSGQDAARVRIASSPTFDSTDATAATQMGQSPALPPITSSGDDGSRPSTSQAIQTDLSSARDSPIKAPDAGRSSMRWPIVVGALVAVLAIGGVALYVSTTPKTVADTRPHETASPTPPPTPTPTPTPSVLPVPSFVAPSASVVQPPPTNTPRNVTTTTGSRSLGWGNVPHQ